jgi:hypothetical protein
MPVVATTVVRYQLDDDTTVAFEVEPSAGFRPAGPNEIAGQIRQAVEPAVDAARAVLDRVREAAPAELVV